MKPDFSDPKFIGRFGLIASNLRHFVEEKEKLSEEIHYMQKRIADLDSIIAKESELLKEMLGANELDTSDSSIIGGVVGGDSTDLKHL